MSVTVLLFLQELAKQGEVGTQANPVSNATAFGVVPPVEAVDHQILLAGDFKTLKWHVGFHVQAHRN